MEKQYCKVGTSTSIISNSHATTILEYQYQRFLENASNPKYSDSNLREYFEQKAKKLGKLLESLV